jgi:hypothetical protein
MVAIANSLYPEVHNIGYRKYIAKLFHFSYPMSGQCEYDFMSKESDDLTAFLDSITGKELLTIKDREPLIHAIHTTALLLPAQADTLSCVSMTTSITGIVRLLLASKESAALCAWAQQQQSSG